LVLIYFKVEAGSHQDSQDWACSVCGYGSILGCRRTGPEPDDFC